MSTEETPAHSALVINGAVGVGGAVGTGMRLAVTSTLPFGYSTVLVNVVGCMVLGYVTARLRSVTTSALIGTGLTGALTTFSGFAIETLELLSDRPLVAPLYLAGSVVLGLTAATIGLRLGRIGPARGAA